MRFSSSMAPAAAWLIAAACPAFAQAAPACPQVGGGGGQFGNTQSVFDFNGPGIMIRAFTGAPYSWRMSSQGIRTLANGTHLTQRVIERPMMHRDSMGRVRTDSQISTPPAGANLNPLITHLAEIEDPVAGYRYIIDDFHRVVHRMVPCNPGHAAVPRMQRVPAPGTDTSANGVTITNEDLGTQTMFGVTVTGFRQTTTYPPGTFQGNDAPVTRSEETWSSAQYGLDFLRKTTTPEQETTQTLVSFTAAEPDPAMFQVPAGYQIVDETAAFTITIPNGPQ